MDNILHTNKVRFYYDGDAPRYGRLEVYDYKLAKKVNRILETYDNGKYAFQEGEEPIFKVPLNQIQSILDLLS